MPNEQGSAMKAINWFLIFRTVLSIAIVGGVLLTPETRSDIPGTADASQPGKRIIAASGAQTAKYMTAREPAKTPAIDPATECRMQELGKLLYMITHNVYQPTFMTDECGIVVIDGPTSLAGHIRPRRSLVKIPALSRKANNVSAWSCADSRVYKSERMYECR